jgi:hypothetical protein
MRVTLLVGMMRSLRELKGRSKDSSSEQVHMVAERNYNAPLNDYGRGKTQHSPASISTLTKLTFRPPLTRVRQSQARRLSYSRLRRTRARWCNSGPAPGMPPPGPAGSAATALSG